MQIQSSTAIIFDVDKTLIFRDLHELIIEAWSNESPRNRKIVYLVDIVKKALTLNFIKRRLEYFLLIFIDDDYIEKFISILFENSDSINVNLLKRLMKYKRYNYQVILVTALPNKVVRPLADYLDVYSYNSFMIAGILFRDLLGKKIKTYQAIEKDKIYIGAIYSDSQLDFFVNARKNILVNGSKLSVIKK